MGMEVQVCMYLVARRWIPTITLMLSSVWGTKTGKAYARCVRAIVKYMVDFVIVGILLFVKLFNVSSIRRRSTHSETTEYDTINLRTAYANGHVWRSAQLTALASAGLKLKNSSAFSSIKTMPCWVRTLIIFPALFARALWNAVFPILWRYM